MPTLTETGNTFLDALAQTATEVRADDPAQGLVSIRLTNNDILKGWIENVVGQHVIIRTIGGHTIRAGERLQVSRSDHPTHVNADHILTWTRIALEPALSSPRPRL
jgi:hypothetical protein